MPDSSRPIRRGQAVFALAVGAAALSMAFGVDAGLTQGWTEWAKGAWVMAMLVGLLAAVFTLLNALGLLTSAGLAERGTIRPDGKKLSLRHFVTVYAGSLLIGLTLVIWLEEAHGVDGEGAMMGLAGALFLLASVGHPWWVYETIRRLGWFDVIESDTWMRRLLAALAAGLLLTAFYKIA